MQCQVCNLPYAPHELRVGYCLRCLPSPVSPSFEPAPDLNVVRAYEEMFLRFLKTQRDHPELGLGDPRFRPDTQGLTPQMVSKIERRVISMLDLPETN